MDENPNMALQVLCVLVFFDVEANLVAQADFEGSLEFEGLEDVINSCKEYVKKYKKAPKLHFLDFFSPEKLNDVATQALLNSLKELRKSINAQYVVDKLDDILLRGRLGEVSKEVFEGVNNGEPTEDLIEKLSDVAKSGLVQADDGIALSDNLGSLYESLEVTSDFTLGISEFDEIGFVPARKQIMLVLGMSNKGKSWSLIHMGAKNLQHNKDCKILHVSLEMGLEECRIRYIQNLFGLTSGKTKRLSRYILTESIGKDYHWSTLETPEVKGILEPGTREFLKESLKEPMYQNLRIVTWPSKAASVGTIDRYLSYLDAKYSFHPDLLFVDYPAALKLGTRNDLRIELGNAVLELRRLAVEHNCAVVCPIQGNRSGVRAAYLKEDNIAEDFSMFMTADRVLGINVSEEEEKSGLRRLVILKNRSGPKDLTLGVQQSLEEGKFCVKSFKVYPDALKQVLDSSTNPWYTI